MLPVLVITTLHDDDDADDDDDDDNHDHHDHRDGAEILTAPKMITISTMMMCRRS